MPQKRYKTRNITKAAKPESADHGTGGETSRPHLYDEDEEKTCPALKSRLRHRPTDGGERAGRAEGRERPAIGVAERGERRQRRARYVEVERGESERPVPAKGKEKPARVGGPARTNGKEKPAKVDGAEQSGRTQAAAQKPAPAQAPRRPGRPKKVVRGRKPNEANNPKVNERAESDAEAKKVSEDEDDHDFDDGDIPTRIENFFAPCDDRQRFQVGKRYLAPKSVRRPIVVEEDYDSVDDGEGKDDKTPPKMGIPAGQDDDAPNQNIGRRSRKTSLILLSIFLIVTSIMLLIYLTFPELSDEEKAKLKLPTSMNDAKALGQLLSKYKDNFSMQVF